MVIPLILGGGKKGTVQRFEGEALFETHTSQAVEIRQDQRDLQYAALNVMTFGNINRRSYGYKARNLVIYVPFGWANWKLELLILVC
jgi:hypothetical protein